MRKTRNIVTLVLGISVLGSGCTETTQPDRAPTTKPGGERTLVVTLTPITTGFNNPIGIDHHQPTNKVVMSVHYASGLPYNFELVSADGSRAQFSSVSGFTDEVKIATARDGLGGFTPGELFTGTGSAGAIARISADGSTVLNPWVVLPGEPGILRGSLHVDRTGVFGGDLIVVTTAGNVWRVTSAGVPTHLASLGVHLEGLTTVPADAARYGPWSGKILAGAEGQGRIWAIDAAGGSTPFELGINPEDLEVIPANQNFFGVDFGGATLWGAPPSEFASMVGDVLVAQESPGILWHVRWNGSSFDVTQVAQVTQWEHVTFSSAGIVEIPPTVFTFDIHPTSCPNPLNTRSRGVMPAAIVGTAGGDVRDIDLSSIRLEGSLAPIRTGYQDVTAPVLDGEDCECTTAGPDGIEDLTLKFDTQAVVALLGTVSDRQVVTLTISGNLTDGTPFEASDCVIVLSGGGSARRGRTSD